MKGAMVAVLLVSAVLSGCAELYINPDTMEKSGSTPDQRTMDIIECQRAPQDLLGHSLGTMVVPVLWRAREISDCMHGKGYNVANAEPKMSAYRVPNLTAEEFDRLAQKFDAKEKVANPSMHDAWSH